MSNCWRWCSCWRFSCWSSTCCCLATCFWCCSSSTWSCCTWLLLRHFCLFCLFVFFFSEKFPNDQHKHTVKKTLDQKLLVPRAYKVDSDRPERTSKKKTKQNTNTKSAKIKSGPVEKVWKMAPRRTKRKKKKKTKKKKGKVTRGRVAPPTAGRRI